MIGVKIDHSSEMLLHDQIAGGIRRAIADGSLAPGQRLPPTRDLAAAFGVNANTVLRSLRTLRDEGVLDFRRGRGVTVVGTLHAGEIHRLVDELLRAGSRLGYSKAELIDLIKDAT
jgi:DNA-binding transcriptional regulator YhcF (GntR family)